MITVVVRVWMPDRPGALGQVASRVGAVRGDVLGIEILERGADRVVDELTVTLTSADLVELLCQEIDAVDGVSVEDIRVVDDERADPNLSALAAGAAMVEAPERDRIDVLAQAAHLLLEADWTVVLRDAEVITQLGDDSLEVAWLIAFLAGSEHLDTAEDGTLPSDLAWGHLFQAGLTVACGRVERAIHERERIRLSLLARLADGLVSAPDRSGVVSSAP